MIVLYFCLIFSEIKYEKKEKEICPNYTIIRYQNYDIKSKQNHTNRDYETNKNT